MVEIVVVDNQRSRQASCWQCLNGRCTSHSWMLGPSSMETNQDRECVRVARVLKHQSSRLFQLELRQHGPLTAAVLGRWLAV